MLIYWSLFIIIIIIQFIPTKTNKGQRNKLLFSFFLMFIYAAIRDNFGRDYEAYQYIFEDVHKYVNFWGAQPTIEKGYILLNRIMPSHRVLLVFLSAFTCFTYYWLFKTYVPPKYYWLAFLLMSISGNFMLIFQLSGLRNAIAINIMALSLPLIENRKLFPYLLLTVIAFFFHQSVLFFMPLAYFVATPYKLKTRNIVLWSIFILIFLLISALSLINFITPFINLYFQKYASYLDIASEQIYQRSLLMYGFVLIIFFLSFVILKNEKISERETMILKLSLLFIFSIILGVLNFRMSQYFAPYFVIGATIVMKEVKSKKLKYGYLISVILFLTYSFFIVYMGNPDFSYKVYHTIFE